MRYLPVNTAQLDTGIATKGEAY